MNVSIAVCVGVVMFIVAPALARAHAQEPAGSAQAPQARVVDQPSTLADILEQQREIRAALQGNDPRFAHLDSFRRSRIKLNQETVFRRAAGYQTTSEMKADDQLALFNALKRIESLMVKRNEDENMVCERVAIVGTRRYEMACMTREERDDRADGAKKALMERQACTTAACIGGQ